MNYYADLIGYRQAGTGSDLLLRLPEDVRGIIARQHIRKAEIVLDDGRHISTEQRRKIYATIRDISDYTGDPPEIAKEWQKYRYIEMSGRPYFSLSDCSMTVAKEFINSLMDYCLYNGIMLTESGLMRTDDISAYLVQCIVYKRCCICGRPAEIHHLDAIGMGNDRRVYDDSQNEIIALCREHHTLAHSLGRPRFMERYKVYGIKRFEVYQARDKGCFYGLPEAEENDGKKSKRKG